MHSITRTLNVPSALLLLVLVSVIAFQVGAQRQPGAASCTCVVSVDLPAVLDGLNERAQAELKLKAMRDERIAEDTRKQDDLKALQEQLEAIPPTEKKRRQEMQEDLTLAALEYNAWRAFSNEQLDIEKSLMFRELDRSVARALQELSAANGYDIVLMNDSAQKLGVNPEANMPREMQVRQQMTGRRALYVSPAADITQELVQRMNNAYNAGG